MAKGWSAPAIRSPYHWAVLGLLIELPSYGYELVQRFEPTYGDSLDLSTGAHVYKALDALAERGLIEALPTKAPAPGARGHPKPSYRATAAGVRGYEDYLVAQAREERRRSWLLTRQFTLLSPQAATGVIDRLEHAYQQEAKRAPVDSTDDGFLGGASELTSELIRHEHRLTVKARLSWIKIARRKLQALAAERGTQR